MRALGSILPEGEDEEKWEHGPGRLAEDVGTEDEIVRRMLRGRARRVAGPGFRAPAAPSSRPASTAGRVTLHARHATIAKLPQTGDASPRPGDASPGRVYVYPGRRDVAAVKAAGGRRERKTGRWYLPGDASPSGRLADLVTREAARRWLDRRAGVGQVMARPAPTRPGALARVVDRQCFRRPLGTAGEYQRYIERAGLAEADLREALVHDALGPVSFGTLGDTVEARVEYWRGVERKERADGRVQCQWIIEVALELMAEPSAVRRFAEAAVSPLRERGLDFWVAAHLPEVEHGSDPRNVHLHIVYHDRARVRAPDDRLQFADRKDREARGDAWIAGWRERLVADQNRILAEIGAAKRYDARSYREMGIDKEAGEHLGPSVSQRERTGAPTSLGVRNAAREWRWREAGGGDWPPDAPVAVVVRRALAGSETGQALAPELVAARSRAKRELKDWTDLAERERRLRVDLAACGDLYRARCRLAWLRATQDRAVARGDGRGEDEFRAAVHALRREAIAAIAAADPAQRQSFKRTELELRIVSEDRLAAERKLPDVAEAIRVEALVGTWRTTAMDAQHLAESIDEDVRLDAAQAEQGLVRRRLERERLERELAAAEATLVERLLRAFGQEASARVAALVAGGGQSTVDALLEAAAAAATTRGLVADIRWRVTEPSARIAAQALERAVRSVADARAEERDWWRVLSEPALRGETVREPGERERMKAELADLRRQTAQAASAVLADPAALALAGRRGLQARLREDASCVREVAVGSNAQASPMSLAATRRPGPTEPPKPFDERALPAAIAISPSASSEERAAVARTLKGLPERDLIAAALITERTHERVSLNISSGQRRAGDTLYLAELAEGVMVVRGVLASRRISRSPSARGTGKRKGALEI